MFEQLDFAAEQIITDSSMKLGIVSFIEVGIKHKFIFFDVCKPNQPAQPVAIAMRRDPRGHANNNFSPSLHLAPT